MWSVLNGVAYYFLCGTSLIGVLTILWQLARLSGIIIDGT